MIDYADDIVFFASDKKILRRLIADMEHYLARELKLEIKANKQIFFQ